MRHFSKLFCFFLAFSLAGSVNAQLSAGDIAFVGYDGDTPEAVFILALAKISAGTEIKFTDNGWQAAGGFRTGEGIWAITFTADIHCGTEIQINSDGAFNLQGGRVGTNVSTGTVALSADGDQMLAYQGAEDAPVFLAAINAEGNGWQSGAGNPNSSALPPGLSNGKTAIALAEIDNAKYNCAVVSGTQLELLMAINNPANWSGDNTLTQGPAGCTFSSSDCPSPPPGGGGEDCMDLFLSEYIEGSGNNKCIELYNPTGAAINLSGYILNISRNGGTQTADITFSGTIPAFGTYVVCNPSADMAFLDRADQTDNNINHNGDDTYTLLKDGNVIDRFGQLGFDPGSQWSSGGVSTAEQTLVRKESVTKGDPNATDPFDPSVEWDSYGRDDASFLGAHTSACGQSGPGPGGEDCMDLFLSEYIEGSGNNKCIELYNPTGAAINLSGYVLNLSRNGGTSVSDITFSGTIPAFGTYVVCNSSADIAFLNRADQTDNNINHNGDDTYTLLKDGNVIDRFGQLGFDPGSQWSSGGVSTAEQTLVRKESVTKGDPNATDPFDPSVEWDGYGRDDASFLGAHTSACGQSGPGGEDCMDLFLSEYIEGSGNNKCIELYNPTGAAINLSDYVLNISRNGGTQTADITFSGTIPAFGTYVVCNSSADMAFLDRADQTDNNINHNGDDAYTLLKDGVVIDRFGQLGFDPGSQWSAGGVSTAEQTLVRKESVAKGDPNAGDPFDPSVEWDSYGRDDASFLGFHISDCVDVAECLITGVMINPITGCRDNGSDSQGDDFYLAEVTVAVTNPPATGDLELYGPNGFITEITAGSITGGMAVFSNVELPANALPVMVTASFSSTDCSGDGMAPPVYPCSLPDCTPVINELDYDNPGTDDREFVELYNPCSQAVNLADYSVIFVNGNNGEIYGDFQLPSVMLGPGEFFVICGDGANTPNCDLDVSPNTNLIQNGDPDAVALLYIQAIADAVSYEGNTTGFTEGSGEGLFDPGAPQLGIGRYVDGVDTDQNNADFSIQCITPGEPNTNVSQYCSIPDGITVAPISCTGFNDAEYDADTDTYTLTSACAHYFGAQDQELLVGADACGFNTEVSARITGVNPTFGYAGVTMRESNAPGARKMSIIRYANGRKIVEYRPSPNAPFYQYWLPAYTIYADYVRISRWGDYFFAAVSFDGVYWTTIYQQYMGGMPNCVLAGMTVSSYANGATTEASFTNFNITGSAIPPRPLAPGAINPEEAVSSLNVFPNPVVDELSVTIGNAPAEEATISILALDGRELYRGVHNINGNTVNLQLAPLQMTPGMYILTANTGEEVLTKRFVKADQ